jgi:uncharacterized sporulation protein YeaH/YhbH (DUF444 family)
MAADYPSEEWNLYVFQFSDGDNWSTADTRTCMELLKSKILPGINLFCYGQVDSEYGSGQYYNDLKNEFAKDERIVLSKIPDRNAIMNSIREFLGKGK